MKFGARKAEPTYEPVSEEAPTKKYEVLPRKLPRESGTKFGASKAELTLQNVPPKGTAYKVFTGGGMKFGREKPGSPQSSASR